MLVGRETEQRTVDALLQSARGECSATLVLRGEPGIGKTALLGYAVDSASDMTVLRCVGIEAEHELPFAGMHQLVRPCLGLVDRLPAPQAAAMRGALGLSFDGVQDRFLVSAGLLSLLAEACDGGPVECCIDDAQWLDRPSAEALVFAARRFQAEPIAMLMAAREGDPRRFDAPGLDELVLDGLDEEDARDHARVASGRGAAAPHGDHRRPHRRHGPDRAHRRLRRLRDRADPGHDARPRGGHRLRAVHPLAPPPEPRRRARATRGRRAGDRDRRQRRGLRRHDGRHRPGRPDRGQHPVPDRDGPGRGRDREHRGADCDHAPARDPRLRRAPRRTRQSRARLSPASQPPRARNDGCALGAVRHLAPTARAARRPGLAVHGRAARPAHEARAPRQRLEADLVY